MENEKDNRPHHECKALIMGLILDVIKLESRCDALEARCLMLESVIAEAAKKREERDE